MQPVGKLDENDADILDHRKHHLAEALCLCLTSRPELNLIELADTVDEQSDFAAEICFDLAYRRLGILDVSCRIAAMMASESRCISASDCATATGWEI